MNKGLLAVLVVLAVVAGVVLIPRLSKKPPEPTLEVHDTMSPDTPLRCAHCRATFAAKDAAPAPTGQGMVLCPKCHKPTPRKPVKPSH